MSSGPESRPLVDVRLRLDFITAAEGKEGAGSGKGDLSARSTASAAEGERRYGSATPADIMALHESVAHDVDQQFLRWCDEDTTRLFVSELVSTMKANPGQALDYRSCWAKALHITTPISIVSPTPKNGGLMLSPRGSRSPVVAGPGQQQSSGSFSSPPTSISSPGGRQRSTPPMSPTGGAILLPALSTSGGFRSLPLSPTRSGRSPPTSPRHFTFPGGAAHMGAPPSTSPGAGGGGAHGGDSATSPRPSWLEDAPGSSSSSGGGGGGGGGKSALSPRMGDGGGGSGGFTSMLSPSSPVVTHGMGIAMNILSPSSGATSVMVPLSSSPGEAFSINASGESSSGSPHFRADSDSTPGSYTRVPAPISTVGGSGTKGGVPVGHVSAPISPSISPASTSPASSPASAGSRAARIAAANVEAFPVSPSPVSPGSGGYATSPPSYHRSLGAHGAGAGHHASAFPVPGTQGGAGGGGEKAHSPGSAGGHRLGGVSGFSSSSSDGKEGVDEVYGGGEAKVGSPAHRRPSFTSDSKLSEALGNVTIDGLGRSLGPVSAHIPPFFVPGQGGRGRGRCIPGDRLEDKLPLIVDLFKRNNATPTPAPPLISGGSSTGSTPPRVQVGSMSLSWEDAHLGLPVEHFAAVAKTLCGFPSFFAAPLFRRIRAQFVPTHLAGQPHAPAVGFNGTLDALLPPNPEVVQAPGGEGGGVTPHCRLHILEMPPKKDDPADRDTTGVVPLPLFLEFWRREVEPFDAADRFFRLVKKRASKSIDPADFMPFLEELLAFHPGLAFLESTPEFQEKYARTVIARIFFVLDPTARRCIDVRQLRKSNVVEAFHTVDVEEDINVVNDYFSYEHFYVLYCKFWELDADHDFLLSRADLSKLSDLTNTVLDRVFAGCGRPSIAGVPGKMGYEDFIAFFMSEEDKTSEAALRYWFRVCDLDGDGLLTPDDLRVFYREQEQRMRSFGMEVIQFADVFCQLHDLLKPKQEGYLTIEDFLHPDRIKLTGVLFSAVFNLSKFQSFEARDPIVVKQELNMQGVTQWDRYAQGEYARLASEEEEAAASPSINNAMAFGSYGDGPMGNGGGLSGSFHLEDDPDDDDRDGPINVRSLDNLGATMQAGRRL